MGRLKKARRASRRKAATPQAATLTQPVKPYVGPTPTVCLSVIVKNESRVIRRMLESVWPVLDRYVVVDTGSTDGTQDIIREFFAEKGIPGEVLQREWVSFEDARNFAREAVEGKADFGFWIDADETLHLPDGFDPDAFKRSIGAYDGANVRVFYGGQEYFRMQFFSTRKPWRWYGVVHEVLVCDEPNQCAIAEGIHVVVNPDGNSWTSETVQQKYEGHARLLLPVVERSMVEGNTDPRWVFYLAQSYRDANTPENLEKALYWYRERLRHTESGYWEELYYSQLMVATISGRLQKPENEIFDEHMKCGRYNRMRIEHLMPPVKLYHQRGDFDTSYIFSSHAMRLTGGSGETPFPRSSLFIDNRTYHFDVLHFHMLNSWYVGRRDEASQAYAKLERALKLGRVPQDMVEITVHNGEWFRTQSQPGKPVPVRQ